MALRKNSRDWNLKNRNKIKEGKKFQKIEERSILSIPYVTPTPLTSPQKIYIYKDKSQINFI